MGRDEFDLDQQKATHNELLKQLLGTAGARHPTPDVSTQPGSGVI